MSRQIRTPINVEIVDAGESVAFTWRSMNRRVEVIGRWRLRDHLWVTPAEADRTGKVHSARHYFRLMTAQFQVFEVYQELTSTGLWVLDVVHD